MAVRILLLILGFVIAVNIVLSGVGLAMNVNLYEKYGKQILIFFGAFAVVIVLVYVVLGVLGLI
ncbi:hypothetical protein IKQ26_09170 [bacterium]|nr:hypothetical protein [bacterium]